MTQKEVLDEPEGLEFPSRDSLSRFTLAKTGQA